ncbi:hypothetical protein O9929_25195 [Vibrio lentus]|nr:hypothetical protein [Vibrio lentus]
MEVVDVPSTGAPSSNAVLHLPQVGLFFFFFFFSEILSELGLPFEGQRVECRHNFLFLCNSVSNAIYESPHGRLYCFKTRIRYLNKNKNNKRMKLMTRILAIFMAGKVSATSRAVQ